MAARALAQTLFSLIILAPIIFVPAGDWSWAQGWIFLWENAIASLIIVHWLLRHDPALLQARLSRPVHRDQKRWDRIFLPVALVCFLTWMILIALDARRFGWSHVPLWVEGLGAVLIALCMLFVWDVFRHNSFAAPQVRLQSEQRVVTEGPYATVRHPMYAAAILYFVGAPLLLGSWWGLPAVPVFVLALGARAVGEERMLRHALPDYDDYARRVSFRLLPGVW